MRNALGGLLSRSEHDAAGDRARAGRAISRTATGRRYLDGSASAGVVGIGHGRSEICEALAREGDKVTFVYNATFTHPWQEELAGRILDMAPADMAGVYFVSGGSEANEFGLEARAAVLRRDAASRRNTRRSRAGRAITA